MMGSKQRAKNKKVRQNPLTREVRTLFGPEPPRTLEDHIELARKAQYFDAREKGMSDAEARAYVSTLNFHPNRRRGVPNVPIPTSRERKNGVTIAKKISKQALAREIKEAERQRAQVAESQSRVVKALIQSAGHPANHPAVQAAKQMSAPANQRLRRLRARQRGR